jgi:small subunit ribosomal protein S18
MSDFNEMDDRGDYGQRGGRFSARRKMQNQRLEKASSELYKDPDLLRRYLTDRGKIRPRRQTGLSAKEQRRLAVAVKRARHLALLPFTAEHSRGE